MSGQLTDTDFSKLTDKQRRFCEEYAIDWNATRAAIAAGYSKKTAYRTGADNLRKPQIKAYLDHIRDNLAEAAGVSPLWALKGYKADAEADISLLLDVSTAEEFRNLPAELQAAVKKFKRSTTVQGPIVTHVFEFEIHDKQAARKAVRDMLGWDAPKRKELSGPGGGAIPYENVSDGLRDLHVPD